MLWPEDVASEELELIRDCALITVRATNTPYTEQPVVFLCDPLVWFERGWAGARAAGDVAYGDSVWLFTGEYPENDAGDDVTTDSAGA